MVVLLEYSRALNILHIENNTLVPEIPDLFRVLNMISEISCSTREINLVFPSTHVFFVYYINYRFSTNIKCPEAMTGDCLKSDNFHM